MIDPADLERLEREAKADWMLVSDARHLMPRLQEFLALLPGVSVASASRQVRSLHAELMTLVERASFTPPELGPLDTAIPYLEPALGVIVTTADLDHLVAEDGHARRITPRGAAIVLRLYAAQWMSMHQQAVPGPAPDAETYAISGPVIAVQAAQERAEAAWWREQRPEPIDPASVQENDFSVAKLEAVFASHFGEAPGERRMVIGGIEVSRHLDANLSNSGRRKGRHVWFSWISAGGQQHIIPAPDSRVLSRWQDPDRNWGMRRRE